MKPSLGKNRGHLYRLKDPTNEAGSKSSMSGVFCLLNLAAIASLIEMHISSTPTFTMNNIPTMSATPTCNIYLFVHLCTNKYNLIKSSVLFIFYMYLSYQHAKLQCCLNCLIPYRWTFPRSFDIRFWIAFICNLGIIS